MVMLVQEWVFSLRILVEDNLLSKLILVWP
jgi:hypothetical protein